jgi:hypothetical protein
MGRNSSKNRRRKQRRANAAQWRMQVEEDQQETSLDTQRQRELHFTCVNQAGFSLVSTLERVRVFCSSVGPVDSVFHINVNSSNNSSNSITQPNRSTAIEAVVEMATAEGAQRILSQRQTVLFFNKQQERPVPQLALPASFGFLKSCSCCRCNGRIGRACVCQRYCK